MIIGIDFDGTCVRHEFPRIGKDIGAVPVLKRLVDAGHQLVLNTMRSENLLEDAVLWFKVNNIPLYGKNNTPGQLSWTKSPKVYANISIDDAALGCPLKIDDEGYKYVDWEIVEKMLFGDNK